MIFPPLNPRGIPDEEFIEETFLRLFGRGPSGVIYRNGQPYKIVPYKSEKVENDEKYFGGLIRISTVIYRKIR